MSNFAKTFREYCIITIVVLIVLALTGEPI
jgi:hypothetical protein